MIHQPEIKYLENVEFSEGHIEKDIETDSPYQEEILEQEYNRPRVKHYKDNPE